MTVMLACSAKGSPGVTTSLVALALQWPRPVILGSADPAGDDLRAGILHAAAPTNRGLLDLALSLRRGQTDVAADSVCLSADERSVWVLPGVTDPAQMEVLSPHWPALAKALVDSSRDVLLDCGRATTQRLPAPLTDVADLLAVVVNPTLMGVDRARPLASRLLRDVTSGRSAAEVGVLCVGDAPYQPDEVARALDIPLFGVLPHDATGAQRLAEGEVAWRRPLLRAAHGVAQKLCARVSPRLEFTAAVS